ncbi:MAG: hypothetical protein Q9166_007985 [cf. Caloplaca sp. 2 TL-2023]
MAPRPSVSKKKGRLPKSGPCRATPMVKKSIQPPGTRKGLRSQNKSPVSHPVKVSPTSSAPISPPAHPKRKRSRNTEAEADEPKDRRPAKQPRITVRPRLKPSEGKSPKDTEAGARAEEPESPPEQPQEPPPVLAEDLQSLKSVYEKVMISAASSALKRSASCRSRAPSETETERTQRSNNNNAFYRRNNLAAVKIRLHAEPPSNIKTTIKGIVNAKVSKQRQAELYVIAQGFHDDCLKHVRAQSGEDDFLDPLHNSIKALRLENLCIHEKATWRAELKPVARQQTHFSSSFMAVMQQLEVDDASIHEASVPPRKRQQKSTKQKPANENYISPESSMVNASAPPANDPQRPSTMPPPAPVPTKEEDRSPIKTPIPDLTMGIDLGALTSALSSQDLDADKATEFIEWVQNEMVKHESDGPLEPMLLLVPAPRALDLTFPFAVVEGKAYSTGKQIFEAENQAAVSMACAHKLLYCLDRMANGEITTNTQPRVLFSITTQGPIHEIWAHWIVVKDGMLMFESMLWNSWNGLVLERAEDFIVALNSLCVWGTGRFLDSVVMPLRKVVVKAKA